MTKHTSLRLKPGEVEWIEAEAKRTGRSTTEIIRAALENEKNRQAVAEVFEKNLAAARAEISEKLAEQDAKVDALGRLLLRVYKQVEGEP